MSRSIIRSFLTTLLSGTLLISAVSCGQTEGVTKGPITVGSKIDTEGSVLAAIIVQVLENDGFIVNDKSSTGPTSVVRKAIMSGELDIYPEYTGNGAFFFDEADSPVWKDGRMGYERVKELDAANDLVWLTPAAANNTWAIAIPRSFADQSNIRSLADLAGYINNGGYLKLIGSEEFVTSQAALPAFQIAYGFSLTTDQLVTVSSGDTAQTEKAAAQGTDGVNAAMAYGTDGAIAALDLVVLEDPLNVQPVYLPAPLIRKEVANMYPEIESLLTPVFSALELETLQTLNGKVAVDGESPSAVAKEWLTSMNFLK